jgi:hypothetical protein
MQGLDLVKIGADNPDNVYHSAPVNGRNTYRVRGTRGSIAYVSVGSKANGTPRTAPWRRPGSCATTTCSSSPTARWRCSSAQPAAGQLAAARAGQHMIVLRQSYLDRASEQPGHYTIENLADLPPAGPLEPSTWCARCSAPP